MVDEGLLSNKPQKFRTGQLEESIHNIEKKKRKKALFHAITVISILILAAFGTTATSVIIPPIVITVLSYASAVLTGVSSRFNFQGFNNGLEKEIE